MAKLTLFPKKPPKDISRITLSQLCSWIYISGQTIGLDDTGQLTLTKRMPAPCTATKDEPVAQDAPEWLAGVTEAHTERLRALAWCRAMDDHIAERLLIMQNGCSPEIIAKGIAYVERKVNELAERGDMPEGYDDPASPFAWECVSGYRETLRKLREVNAIS